VVPQEDYSSNTPTGILRGFENVGTGSGLNLALLGGGGVIATEDPAGPTWRG
jgi:hypothetical protein